MNNAETHIVLSALGFLLFFFVGFKFIRNGLDSGRYFFLSFIGALIAAICASFCFIYCVFNLLEYGSQIGRQHFLTSLNSRDEALCMTKENHDGR